MVKYVDINGVNVALDVKIEVTDVNTGPIRVEGFAGDFAFGDVRLVPHIEIDGHVDELFELLVGEVVGKRLFF